MDRTERFYKIDQMLHHRKLVKTQDFVAELGVSLATFKRDMSYLRERLHAPIIYDYHAEAYRFGDKNDKHSPPYELPGLWFNAGEIYALLTMQHLLATLQPNLLSKHIEPLQARLRTLIDQEGIDTQAIQSRVKIISMERTQEPQYFEVIAQATLKRLQLRLDYLSRATGEESQRVVSPQRLVHYRDNWYLDAYCHLRQGLRSFSLDAITRAELQDAQAIEVEQPALNAHFGSGYGIFAGDATQTAILQFDGEYARYAAAHQWHPQQVAQWLDNGHYEIRLPYSDGRELLKDILGYGAHAKVIAPDSLRQAVKTTITAMKAHYDAAD